MHLKLLLQATLLLLLKLGMRLEKVEINFDGAFIFFYPFAFSQDISSINYFISKYHITSAAFLSEQEFLYYNLSANHNRYKMWQNEIEGADNIFLVPINFSWLCEKKMVA